MSSGGVNLTACAHCQRRDVPLLCCEGCRRVAYCSETCQRAHWKQKSNAHRFVCKRRQQQIVIGAQSDDVVAAMTAAADSSSPLMDVLKGDDSKALESFFSDTSSLTGPPDFPTETEEEEEEEEEAKQQKEEEEDVEIKIPEPRVFGADATPTQILSYMSAFFGRYYVPAAATYDEEENAAGVRFDYATGALELWVQRDVLLAETRGQSASIGARGDAKKRKRGPDRTGPQRPIEGGETEEEEEEALPPRKRRRVREPVTMAIVLDEQVTNLFAAVTDDVQQILKTYFNAFPPMVLHTLYARATSRGTAAFGTVFDHPINRLWYMQNAKVFAKGLREATRDANIADPAAGTPRDNLLLPILAMISTHAWLKILPALSQFFEAVVPVFRSAGAEEEMKRFVEGMLPWPYDDGHFERTSALDRAFVAFMTYIITEMQEDVSIKEQQFLVELWYQLTSQFRASEHVPLISLTNNRMWKLSLRDYGSLLLAESYRRDMPHETVKYRMRLKTQGTRDKKRPMARLFYMNLLQRSRALLPQEGVGPWRERIEVFETKVRNRHYVFWPSELWQVERAFAGLEQTHLATRGNIFVPRSPRSMSFDPRRTLFGRRPNSASMLEAISRDIGLLPVTEVWYLYALSELDVVYPSLTSPIPGNAPIASHRDFATSGDLNLFQQLLRFKQEPINTQVLALLQALGLKTIIKATRPSSMSEANRIFNDTRNVAAALPPVTLPFFVHLYRILLNRVSGLRQLTTSLKAQQREHKRKNNGATSAELADKLKMAELAFKDTSKTQFIIQRILANTLAIAHADFDLKSTTKVKIGTTERVVGLRGSTLWSMELDTGSGRAFDAQGRSRVSSTALAYTLAADLWTEEMLASTFAMISTESMSTLTAEFGPLVFLYAVIKHGHETSDARLRTIWDGINGGWHQQSAVAATNTSRINLLACPNVMAMLRSILLYNGASLPEIGVRAHEKETFSGQADPTSRTSTGLLGVFPSRYLSTATIRFLLREVAECRLLLLGSPDGGAPGSAAIAYWMQAIHTALRLSYGDTPFEQRHPSDRSAHPQPIDTARLFGLRELLDEVALAGHLDVANTILTRVADTVAGDAVLWANKHALRELQKAGWNRGAYTQNEIKRRAAGENVPVPFPSVGPWFTSMKASEALPSNALVPQWLYLLTQGGDKVDVAFALLYRNPTLSPLIAEQALRLAERRGDNELIERLLFWTASSSGQGPYRPPSQPFLQPLYDRISENNRSMMRTDIAYYIPVAPSTYENTFRTSPRLSDKSKTLLGLRARLASPLALRNAIARFANQ